LVPAEILTDQGYLSVTTENETVGGKIRLSQSAAFLQKYRCSADQPIEDQISFLQKQLNTARIYRKGKASV